jgi:hypothetical protein
MTGDSRIKGISSSSLTTITEATRLELSSCFPTFRLTLNHKQPTMSSDPSSIEAPHHPMASPSPDTPGTASMTSASPMVSNKLTSTCIVLTYGYAKSAPTKLYVTQEIHIIER